MALFKSGSYGPSRLLLISQLAVVLLLLLAMLAQLWLSWPLLAVALVSAGLVLLLAVIAGQAAPARLAESRPGPTANSSAYALLSKALRRAAADEPVRVAAVLSHWLRDEALEPTAESIELELAPEDQVAAVLMLLEKADAARVLRELSPTEIQRVAQAMAGLEAPSAPQMAELLQRFSDDVTHFSAIKSGVTEDVCGLLEQALGPEKARLINDQLAVSGQSRQLGKLKWLDASVIAAMLHREHPQIQAVLIASLAPKQASDVLLALPEERRVDLLSRMSALETLSSAALQELDWLVEDYLNNAGRGMGRALTGEAIAASLLNELDVATEAELLNGLRRMRPGSAESVEDLMFGFEQLERLSDADLDLLLKQLNPAMVRIALRGAPRNLARRVVALRPEVGRDSDDTRVTQAEVRVARNEIVTVAKRMAAVGEVVLDARKLDVF